MEENRLKIIRREQGGINQQELADFAGVPLHKIKDAETGKVKISAEIALAMEEKFNYSFRWVLSGEGPRKKEGRVEEAIDAYNGEQFKEVGVYALAGAGPARDLVEHEPIEMIVVPKSFWKPSIAAIKVRGRSMEPLILDGAYLGIDREDKWIISGEIYAVWIPYEGAVIKRLYIDPERITLRSDNKDFPEFSILVKEASAEMILGRVKWVLQQF
ncbi:MAG: XRE family transcriptional regulator [Desulfuromonadales bacterium]|nr:XRE family transcriptional regulator [Desulfuromonadales bacterium]